MAKFKNLTSDQFEVLIETVGRENHPAQWQIIDELRITIQKLLDADTSAHSSIGVHHAARELLATFKIPAE